jgi:hypothetical protein
VSAARISRRDRKEPELHPDAWQRFERAVDIVAKSPPQHRTKKAKLRKRAQPKPRKLK